METLKYTARLIIIWTLLCLERASNTNNDVWKPVTVSASLMRNITNTGKTLKTSSDIVCAMNASRYYWANLFCFNNGVCEVSSYLAVPYPSATIISDSLDCMTKLDGCIYEATLYNYGDYILVPKAPTCLICKPGQNGLMIPLPYNSHSPGTCDLPVWKSTLYGCFSGLGPSGTFCDNRIYCQSIGGDLWTFEHNMTLKYFNTAIGVIGVPSNQFMIGLYGNGTQVNWISGAPFVDEGDPFYPPSISPPLDGNCIKNAPTYNRLGFKPCDDVYAALCQKNILP